MTMCVGHTSLPKIVKIQWFAISEFSGWGKGEGVNNELLLIYEDQNVSQIRKVSEKYTARKLLGKN